MKFSMTTEVVHMENCFKIVRVYIAISFFNLLVLSFTLLWLKLKDFKIVKYLMYVYF